MTTMDSHRDTQRPARLLRWLFGAHARRLNRDLRRRAEWAAEARNAPTLLALEPTRRR